MDITEAESNRKRKVHKKSRRGCGNCKLRRVKCDERRPECKKCIAFSVCCDYSGSKPADLASSMTGSFSVSLTQNKPSEVITFLGMVNGIPSQPGDNFHRENQELCDFRGSNQWRRQDLDLVKKFQTRTVLTIGTGNSMPLYQKEAVELAAAYPFLMHCLLTLTMMHDRFLANAFQPTQSTEEVRHWYRGTSLFKDALSKMTHPGQEKDALWAAAALLGAIQFSHLEARLPEEAWPMKPSAPEDLDWLQMSDGKKAVWAIADPLRPESVFKGLAAERKLVFQPRSLSVPHVEAPYSEFADVFELNERSTTETNPYHDAGCALARLLHIECNKQTVLEFLTFISHVQPELKKLIERKEARALLLLACWYAKVYKYQWWVYRRGLLEGQAICMYLDEHHPYEEALHRLLEYPKRLFGMLRSGESRAAAIGKDSFASGWMYLVKSNTPWRRPAIAHAEAV